MRQKRENSSYAACAGFEARMIKGMIVFSGIFLGMVGYAIIVMTIMQTL